MQREKPTGFSLCCFGLFFLLLLIPAISYGQRIKKEIYHNALNGNFTRSATLATDIESSETNPAIATPTLISATIEAFLEATPEKIDYAAKLAGNILEMNEASSYDEIFAYSAKSLLNALEEDYVPALYTSLKAYSSLKQHLNHQNCIEPEIIALATIFNSAYKKIPSGYWFLLNMAGIDSLSYKKTQACPDIKYPELVSTLEIVQQTLNDKDTLQTNRNTPAMGHLIAAAYYLKKQIPKMAGQHLKKIDSTGNYPATQFYYWGVMRLNLGHYETSEWYFNKYLFLQQKGRYIKSALLRKKWIAVLKEQPFSNLDRAIENRGTAYTFADRQALKEYRDQYHPGLLEARICFDGGRFRDALQVLNSIDTKNLTQYRLNEYHYRKARAHQLQKQNKKALDEYRQLLELPNDGHYYHKKAMLERGKIFLDMGITSNANKSLKQVMQVKSNMYSKVIEHEAEMLLEKIENSKK
ncbi:hypothetical protein L21SP5_00520 [Salinivirga cyanobacteriivorans]|uniref:Tetratricopeptide repeat protein n=1 Tax=Salinivirga cyanobacteriivorans TaxID=1307839 RepID=A0A0S2HW44_9BACT|nr:hypothetical protein [Salinivirga cyanobacteriivorans]ALO14196.1 hypothetical protein L21SP5_00520 [Salinivirga cyanobacteriivorans]